MTCVYACMWVELVANNDRKDVDADMLILTDTLADRLLDVLMINTLVGNHSRCVKDWWGNKERWGRLNWALLVPFANLCAAETIGSHTSSSQKKIPCRTINIPPSETSPCFWSLSSDKKDKKMFFIAPGPLSGMNYLVMPNLWYANVSESSLCLFSVINMTKR